MLIGRRLVISGRTDRTAGDPGIREFDPPRDAQHYPSSMRVTCVIGFTSIFDLLFSLRLAIVQYYIVVPFI
jgi:hypothetical protein